MIPSPMNLSTMPPPSSTTRVIAVMYSLRKDTTAWGAMRSVRRVKPSTSEKRMVARTSLPPRASFCSRLRTISSTAALGT